MAPCGLVPQGAEFRLGPPPPPIGDGPTIPVGASARFVSAFDALLIRVVTGSTKGTQFAKPEQMIVALMSLDVVGNGRNTINATSLTHRAHWMRSQLSRPYVPPALRLVPCAPGLVGLTSLLIGLPAIHLVSVRCQLDAHHGCRFSCPC